MQPRFFMCRGLELRTYLARRLLLSIPTLFGLTVLIFGAMRVLPGGGLGAFVVDDMVSQQLTDAQIQLIKQELGLDRPLIIQYATWMRDVFDGSFGYSQSRNDEPIRDLILRTWFSFSQPSQLNSPYRIKVFVPDIQVRTWNRSLQSNLLSIK